MVWSAMLAPNIFVTPSSYTSPFDDAVGVDFVDRTSSACVDAHAHAYTESNSAH